VETLVEQINQRFNKTTLNPVILLDGGWGVGKTHFINEEYIKSEPKKFLVISMMGITTLQQFHEKLLSKYFSKSDSKNIKHAQVALNGLSNYFTKLTGTTPLVDAFSGIAKHLMLSKISDITLIVDDLERVHDINLKVLILGEIFDMCAPNKVRGVRSLVIMNHSKSELSHSLMEKIFCWRFKYELSESKAFDIGLSNLTDKESMKSYLISCLKEIGTFNLRVLIRLCENMNQVSTMLEAIGETKIDIKKSKETLFKRMLELSYFYYQLGHRTDEILVNLKSNRLLNDDHEDLDRLYKNHQYTNESKAFIEFTVGCLSRELLEEDLYNLCPVQDELIDFIDARNLSRYSDEEIKEKINKLLDYIENEKAPSLRKWYSAVNFLVYLKDIGVTDNEKLVDLVAISESRINDLTPVKELHFTTFSYDKGLTLDMDSLDSLIAKKQKKTELYDLQNDLKIKSWESLEPRVYEFIRSNNTPFTLTSNEWMTMIKKWTNTDIELFWHFCIDLNNNYGLSRLIDKTTMEDLTILITDHAEGFNHGLNKGLLNRLGMFFLNNMIDKD